VLITGKKHTITVNSKGNTVVIAPRNVDKFYNVINIPNRCFNMIIWFPTMKKLIGFVISKTIIPEAFRKILGSLINTLTQYYVLIAFPEIINHNVNSCLVCGI